MRGGDEELTIKYLITRGGSCIEGGLPALSYGLLVWFVLVMASECVAGAAPAAKRMIVILWRDPRSFGLFDCDQDVVAKFISDPSEVPGRKIDYVYYSPRFAQDGYGPTETFDHVVVFSLPQPNPRRVVDEPWIPENMARILIDESERLRSTFEQVAVVTILHASGYHQTTERRGGNVWYWAPKGHRLYRVLDQCLGRPTKSVLRNDVVFTGDSSTAGIDYVLDSEEASPPSVSLDGRVVISFYRGTPKPRPSWMPESCDWIQIEQFWETVRLMYEAVTHVIADHIYRKERLFLDDSRTNRANSLSSNGVAWVFRCGREVPLVSIENTSVGAEEPSASAEALSTPVEELSR